MSAIDKPQPINLGWTESIPELLTRPHLLNSLAFMPDIRKKLFQCSGDLESIALISSVRVAERCLALYWKDEKLLLHRYWHDKLRTRTGDDTLYNEFYGCIRNIYLNMFVKCGARKRMPCRHLRSMNIERSYK